MNYRIINSETIIVRIIKGERIIESLKKLLSKLKIAGGFFYGIGAVDEVELAHYNVETKKYSSIKFTESFELPSLTGTIGMFEGELLIHAHATVSDKNMTCFGGHLVEARVGGTAEICISQTPKLIKKFDEETGLKLFQLEKELD